MRTDQWRAAVDKATKTWTVVMAETIDRQTHRTETAHQHPIEKRDNTLKTVQTLEACLETQCWEVGCEKWVENEKHMKMWTYQHAINNLEHLVVSHIFELMKMKMSHTGKYINVLPIVLTNSTFRLQDEEAYWKGTAITLASHTDCTRVI